AVHGPLYCRDGVRAAIDVMKSTLLVLIRQISRQPIAVDACARAQCRVVPITGGDRRGTYAQPTDLARGSWSSVLVQDRGLGPFERLADATIDGSHFRIVDRAKKREAQLRGAQSVDES